MAQRGLKGLCFNCPAKFSKEHLKQCPMRGIYIMDMEEDDAGSKSDADGSPEVSIHAMTGIPTGDTMLLHTTVSREPLVALVDLGSTHYFMSTNTAESLGLHPMPRPGLTVGVDNGECVASVGVCPNTTLSIAGEDFCVDIYIIPLAGYELVLGCQWLCTLGPVLWDFKLKTMTFWQDAHRVRWHGVGSTPLPMLSALATVDILERLLQEFSDLFAEPTGLPPQRHLDHRIHLAPDTAPVAVRPYRYP